jgi:hypothetical protein
MIYTPYKENTCLKLGILSFMLVTNGVSSTFQKLFMQHELHISPYIKAKVQKATEYAVKVM